MSKHSERLALPQLPYQPRATEEQSVIDFINQVLQQALQYSASDIHIEPGEKHCRIRLRIDGALYILSQLPVALSGRLTARIKVMSQLDIAEKRLPQDGRFQLNLPGGQTADSRVSTLPALWGEKVVLRLLNPDNTLPPLEQLGFTAEQLQHYRQQLSKPQGLILVTGPTGSGKTVSLYSGLQLLNHPDINIATAEDPVEITLTGVNQVQINPRIGLSFAASLRAFLRQDPDIIMVGEIRDTETAEIAIKAAQTGHLVLSTLHTSSAAETLNRLQQMNIAPYNLASAVTLIMAQRLVRCLCPHCKIPEPLPVAALTAQGFSAAQASQLNLFRAAGCQHCINGYKGRTGIYEVMPVSRNIAALVLQQADAQQIAAQAQQEGMLSLWAAALQKVAAGITSLNEINRVLGGYQACISDVRA
ncbi:ATPase, T2SS/T4P/T4SS family [Chromatiaceae bacterium AAb-1]|nr:ATPase, T2SS/T4P/T4SS family [Chromatiaceae bacterium AAb-1]